MEYQEYARLTAKLGRQPAPPEEFEQQILPGFEYTHTDKRQYCTFSRSVQHDLSEMAVILKELKVIEQKRGVLEARVGNLERSLGLDTESRKTTGVFYETRPAYGRAHECPYCHGNAAKLVIRNASPYPSLMARAYVECPECHARGPYAEMVKSPPNVEKISRLAWKSWNGVRP